MKLTGIIDLEPYPSINKKAQLRIPVSGKYEKSDNPDDFDNSDDEFGEKKYIPQKKQHRAVPCDYSLFKIMSEFA
jgi:hypothetical protein